MALLLGDVVFTDASGGHTSTGIVGALYDMYLSFPWVTGAGRTLPARIAILTMCRGMAQVIADAIRSADVSVTVSVGGLQKTPNPNNPATPTGAPASPVVLTGTLS